METVEGKKYRTPELGEYRSHGKGKASSSFSVSRALARKAVISVWKLDVRSFNSAASWSLLPLP
jgi:hypothetical protein